MTPAEAAELLALAAAFDNRSISEVAARAWSESIDDTVTLDDAKRILVDHYARTREWVMPSDINGASRTLRRTRLDRMQTPEPPSGLGVLDELAWQRAYRRAIGDGYDEGAADLVACEQVGTNRPQITPASRPVMRLVEQAASTTHIPRESS